MDPQVEGAFCANRTGWQPLAGGGDDATPWAHAYQYDPPSPFLLIANYGILFFHDAQLNQTTNIPLSRTPLGILLADQTSLSGDVTVTRFIRLPRPVSGHSRLYREPGKGV